MGAIWQLWMLKNFQLNPAGNSLPSHIMQKWWYSRYNENYSNEKMVSATFEHNRGAGGSF